MKNLLAREENNVYYERKLILMDKCEKVIIRRPVSEEAIATANESLELIIEMRILLKMSESCGIDTATMEDIIIKMAILLDGAAKLAGFRNASDMNDYLKIYGKL